MRKSLLFLLGAAMAMPQLQAVENLGFQPAASPANGYTVQNLAIPFTATGLNFEKDEYNSISVPKDAAYSIGFWYKAKGVGGVFSRNHIFAIAKDEQECYTWTHMMISCNSSGEYYFNTKQNDGGVQEAEEFTQVDAYNMGQELALGTYDMNTWHHMIISVDNANGKLAIYVNGQLDTEATLTAPLIFSNSYLLQFGYFGNSGNVFDEIQFFNRALTAEDAAAAYVNAANVEGVASVYTLNAVAEGTTGTFHDQLIGGQGFDGVVYLKKYNYYWDVPYNYSGFNSKTEVAPTLSAGRDMTDKNAEVKVLATENGTLTFAPVDDATALNEGDNTIPVASSYVVTATPADGYALVALKAKTANGDVILTSGQQVCVLGTTEFSATFSNNFKTVAVKNENNVPYTLYHNGLLVEPTAENSYGLLVGETYKMVFDVPFDKIFNGITVDGNEIAAADNACEFTVGENTAEVIVNAVDKETVNLTINQPMVDGVQAGTLTVSGWNGEITNGKAVKGDVLTMTFVPADGYRFRHYMINGELSVEASVTADADLTLGIDAQAGNEYPAMTRTFTNNVNQQNRYIKSMRQIDGDYLFNAQTAEELGAVYFPGPTNTYLPDGAIVNKTGIRAGHFQIDQATKEFGFVFTPWTEAIVNAAGTCNSEFGWTKYCVFIDWNNDGDFTDEGERAALDEVGCSSGKYNDEANCTKTITVPEGLAQGTYRMRLVFYEPGADNWYETIFDDNQIRNGVAYDFDIDVASSSYDQPRKVSVAPNFAEGGKVEITGVPDQEAGITEITTAFKYVTCVATPNEGVSFINWSTKDKTQLTTETTYVYNGTEDAELVANFGYVINAEVEGNGRLSIASEGNNYTSGSALVYGSEVTITPVADQGYELTSLTLNDQEVTLAADGTYTFTLNENANFKAVFGVHTYTITYASTGEGSIAVGTDYDADTHTVLDELANGAEATDDNLIFVLATPAAGQQINYIKYIAGEGEHILYHVNGGGEYEVADDYSDDASAWYTPAKAIGCVIMGGLDDYNILVDFSGKGTGINGIELDAANGVVEYYNLQGVKVAAENLAPGFYIARQGNKAVKVLINK